MAKGKVQCLRGGNRREMLLAPPLGLLLSAAAEDRTTFKKPLYSISRRPSLEKEVPPATACLVCCGGK